MTHTLVSLWWTLFCTAVGLCIGSFLNVIIYRVPRNKSLRNPLWSACPNCRARIAWYDNIPVLSFIILRGRCRRCSVPIPTRYVVVELLTVIIVLMLLDSFLIGGTRRGIRHDAYFGLTDGLVYDWPILVAHVTLFSCLLAMSIIDLEHYWVDIRFTSLVTIAGVALHIIWTPVHSMKWIRPSDTTAAVAIFAVGGLFLVWLVRICQPQEEMGGGGETEPQPAAGEPAQGGSTPPPSLQQPSRAAGWVVGITFLALLVLLVADEAGVQLQHTGRGLAPLVLMFLLIVGASISPRESDELIIEAIHEERQYARAMVLRELLMLAPAILLGVIGYGLARSTLGEQFSSALHTQLPIHQLRMLRGWMPLEGVATAASGYIVAGGLGWAVRIGFTLVFGKEAFGTGDIHMMAAAGCVAGWPVVLIGFFLSCLIALLGWVISLPFKRTRAIPLGPWLSLGFLTVVIFYDAIMAHPFAVQTQEVLHWLISARPSPDVAAAVLP